MAGDNETITFELPGPCIARALKAKIIGFGRKIPSNMFAKIHKTTKTEKWMEHVAKVGQSVAPKKPWTGPITVTIDIRRGLLQEHMNSDRKLEQVLRGLIFPITKPDLSNYAKGIEDALNKIIYKDDAQIVGLFVTKTYAEEEKTIVTVSKVHDAEELSRQLAEAQRSLF